MSIQKLSTIGTSIGTIDKLLVAGNLKERYESLKEIKSAVTSLSAAETASLLVTNNVNKAHATYILMSKGMTKEMARETLAEAANTTAKAQNTVATFSLSNAYKGLAASIGISTTALTWWIAVIAGVGIAAYTFAKIHKSVEDYRNAAEQAAEENSELKSSIESIDSELETTKSRMKELEDQGSLSFVEQEELQKLRDTTTELERQLEVKKALQNVAQVDARETAIDYFNTSSGQYRYAGWDMSQVEIGNQHYGQALEDIYTDDQLTATEQMLSDYQELINRQEELNVLKADFIKNNPNDYLNNDDYQNLNMESVAVDSAIKNLRDTLTASIDEINRFDDSLDLQKDEALISQINSIQDAFSDLFGDKTSSITESFNQIWDSDSFKQYRTELEQMTLAGDISASVLSSNKNYQALLEKTGATAEEVVEHIKSVVAEMEKAGKISSSVFDPRSMSDQVALLDDMADKFASIDKLYAEFIKNGTGKFSNEGLQSIVDSFKEINGIDVDGFLGVLSSSASTADDVQDAFNTLATQYIFASGCLKGLTDATAEQTIKELEAQGVTNASAIIMNYLAGAKLYAAETGYDMANATSSEIVQLLNEQGVTDETRAVIAAYALQKEYANNVTIATDGDINNIKSLMQACGQGVSAIVAFQKAKAGLMESIKTGDPRNINFNDPLAAQTAIENSVKSAKEYERLAENANKEINAAIANVGSSNSSYNGGSAAKEARKGDGKGSKSKKDASEFDWMERRIEVIDSQVDKLQSKIEKLVGYKAKNSNTDTAIDLMIEKMSILQQMHDRYIEEADKVGLAQDYIDKVQNGTIDIESIADENLSTQIKDFQKWFEKAQDVSDQIEEVTESIHKLNISKLDNIIDQFDKLTDVQSKIIDTEKKILELREKSGDTIYADDYLSLGEKQLEITRQNLNAYNALAAEMSKLNLRQGSDEWKTYNDQLQEYKNNMLSAAEATEDYKDSMTDLVYKGLYDFKDAMDSINGTISTMNSIIGDVNLIDDSGTLTDRGLAQVALYAQQLANSKQEAATYTEAINSLDEALDSGLITQDEYNERLYEYTSAQESAVKSTKDAKDAMIALVKEGIQAQIDAKRKLTDETIAALEAEQDLHNYQNEINEKQTNITTLQKKIDALANATSGTELATRLQLEKELADAQKDLYETQYDHNIEQQKNALEQAYEAYEKEKQDEMDELDSNLAAQEKAIEKYLNEVKKNYSTVYKVLTQYGDEYNLSAIESLTSPWESGSNAAILCADAMHDAISNINFEISSIDMSPLYELIEALNSIGEYGIGGSSSTYEDVTNQGEWKKSGGRWWYGNSSDDYVSGGIYTIDGKQYGFGDDGYMLEGWNDDSGEWRYFEPGNGVMTRSEWKQDKKGNWFYLDKNGVMVTESAVKSKSGDGYYYLDEEGKWDGKTLSYDEVKRQGLQVAYKRGTLSATPGWHLTDEDGFGSEAVVTREGVLQKFNGGETIFNSDAVKNLWSFATDPTRFISGIGNHAVPNIVTCGVGDVYIDMPVHIDGNADERTVAAMKNVIHSEMVKFTKNEMFDVIKTSGKRYR